MPGYGYARASKRDVKDWTRLVFDFLRGRRNLRRVYVLIDARHGLKANDNEALDAPRQGGGLLPGRAHQDRQAEGRRATRPFSEVASDRQAPGGPSGDPRHVRPGAAGIAEWRRVAIAALAR